MLGVSYGYRIMSIEDLKNLAAAFQSVVLAIGVLVGGVWAIYRFRTLGTIEKARAELEKAKRELSCRGLIEIKLDPSLLPASDGSGNYILVAITAKNIGTGTEVILWQTSKVMATRVVYGANGILRLTDRADGINPLVDGELVFSTIHPAMTKTFSVVIPINRNGTYLIDARLSGSPSEMSAIAMEAKAAGVEAELVVWGCTIPFVVTQIPS